MSANPNPYRSPAVTTTWETPFPRWISEEDAGEIRCHLLKQPGAWTAGTQIRLPVLQLSSHLRSALFMCHRNGSLVIGLEEISKTLLNEHNGLKTLVDRHASEPPRRISRILIATAGTAGRFQNNLIRLFRIHSPRLAGLILDCSSDDLSRILFGRSGDIKVVMAGEKNAIHLLLETILKEARRSGASTT